MQIASAIANVLNCKWTYLICSFNFHIYKLAMSEFRLQGVNSHKYCCWKALD